MKLCFLATADSIHSIKWVRYFVDRGHDVYWISLASPSNDNIGNVKLYLINRIFPGKLYPLNWLLYIIQVKRLIRKIKPEILHAHYAGLYGVVALLTGFHPFILTAWGSDILISARSPVKGFFIKRALAAADLLTCDAEHMQKAMIQLGVQAEKITRIHFGVDTLRFHPGVGNKELAQNVSVSDAPTIISLRNLEPIYDIESLVRAIPLVLARRPEARFLIAGRGSQDNMLRNLAVSLGISQSVRFIGHILNEDLPRYLSSADIYVSTSLSDAGIAASTAEAMACGLPVVVTDSGENRKWVKDGESGFIIPVKNPDSLAEKILNLLDDGMLRVSMGASARKVIERENNYYAEMEKMGTIYSSMVRSHGKC